ncbi:Serine/Threonine protein kinase [Orpheovirus IHUMI-LCC2]|uniref:Serine/Threonine protein kinase n=1 Tax=Orpheovirus IHUMI-LCC2 TaxID=2023057 RepID=A0A2I2L3P6_9VIRU|nr:Serine/Threonine protein kinase [Orpheovirus IHUMI-LCC2]SNW62154.1 Serine/Threonine protein kinase [Orpheovirus IHUMI-LCC2]
MENYRYIEEVSSKENKVIQLVNKDNIIYYLTMIYKINDGINVYSNSPIKELTITKNMATLGIAPNIIKYGKINDGVYFTSEKYDMDLLQYLSKYKLTIENKINLINRIDKIIVDMHNAGVVHCDLGPQNFVLKTKASIIEDIKIIDYEYSFYVNSWFKEEITDQHKNFLEKFVGVENNNYHQTGILGILERDFMYKAWL